VSSASTVSAASGARYASNSASSHGSCTGTVYARAVAETYTRAWSYARMASKAGGSPASGCGALRG